MTRTLVPPFCVASATKTLWCLFESSRRHLFLRNSKQTDCQGELTVVWCCSCATKIIFFHQSIQSIILIWFGWWCLECNTLQYRTRSRRRRKSLIKLTIDRFLVARTPWRFSLLFALHGLAWPAHAWLFLLVGHCSCSPSPMVEPVPILLLQRAIVHPCYGTRILPMERPTMRLLAVTKPMYGRCSRIRKSGFPKHWPAPKQKRAIPIHAKKSTTCAKPTRIHPWLLPTCSRDCEKPENWDNNMESQKRITRCSKVSAQCSACPMTI